MRIILTSLRFCNFLQFIENNWSDSICRNQTSRKNELSFERRRSRRNLVGSQRKSQILLLENMFPDRLLLRHLQTLRNRMGRLTPYRTVQLLVKTTIFPQGWTPHMLHQDQKRSLCRAQAGTPPRPLDPVRLLNNHLLQHRICLPMLDSTWMLLRRL